MISARASEGLEWLSMRLLKDAEKAFREGIARNPRDLDCLVGLARVQIEADLAEVAQTVDRVLAIDPAHSEARSHRAYLRAKIGDAAAIEELENLAGSRRAGFWEFYNLGRALAERVDPRAVDAFLRAQQADPQTSLVPIELGKWKQRTEDLAGALEQFEKAIQLSVPAESLPWLLKARAQRAMGEPLQAIATYVTLLGRTPKDRDLYQETFDFCMQAGAFDSALKVANRLRLLDAHDDRYLAWEGRAMVGGGRLKDAFNLLDQALRKTPNSAQIRGALGHAFAALGNDVRALPLLQKAAEQAPTDPLIAVDLAALYARRNARPDEAVRLLLRALEGAPDDPRIHLELARSLAKTDPIRAHNHARRALRSPRESVRVEAHQMLPENEEK